METTTLSLPARFGLKGRVLGSPIFQLMEPARKLACQLEPFSQGKVVGFDATLPSKQQIRLIGKKTSTDLGTNPVLLVPDAHSVRSFVDGLSALKGAWQTRPLDPAAEDLSSAKVRCDAVVTSWADALVVREAGRKQDGTEVLGLRRPQVGALYSALGYATRSVRPGTIVMPTGTGKTETMLALTVAQCLAKLLVVVPTDPLREQIAGKFLSLGVLKDQECLKEHALYPVVLQLEHIPRTVEEVDEVFARANVVVTTMHVAGRAAANIQERMARHATALFIDEAHHVGAKTWSAFRSVFDNEAEPVPVIQFTATPFREDGRPVGGEFIYTYPLKKAQDEGYFTKIRFEAIYGLDQHDADLAIIDKVKEVLGADLAQGLNHLVMARCQSIPRAKALHELYQKLLPDYRPVIVHSDLSGAARTEALSALRAFTSRIIVCVDMLGEGFDLPQLKIAAMHDAHKSVAVTIQFVGRFTRSVANLGEATIIANTNTDDIDRSLAKLYAEDADWNTLVSALSSAKIERQLKRAELFSGFTGDLAHVPLQTLEPRMNAVVYKTKCEEWNPHAVEELYNPGVFLGMKLNLHKQIGVFVTREEEHAAWTTAHQVVNVTWHLHLIHWDQASKLLYIGSSAKGPFDRLAHKLCGEDAERIRGEGVFRSLHGFKRLIVRNLGMTHHQGRGVRFSMFMGVDVTEGLDSAKAQGRIKNNVFGAGFIHGEPATRGCSAKGKFWSLSPVHDLSDWIEWCHEVGTLLMDDSISTDAVFASAMKPRLITERPAVPPVAIHWPEGVLMQLENRVEITFGEHTVPFTDCDIELADHSREGPLTFHVMGDEHSATFEIVFADNGASYPQKAGPTAKIKSGSKTATLAEAFADDSPHIEFGDGSLLIYSHLYELPHGQKVQPFPAKAIEPWNWSGTDISKESQGTGQETDSIQRHVINDLIEIKPAYDVIFDDDGRGEIADVVAIRATEELISVSLFHCKYSSGPTPGARVNDLYEVCGQAQKSVRWRDRPNRMFQHILQREKRRLENGGPSRFQIGNAATVSRWRARWQEYRYEYRMVIVQPGLSQAAMTEESLHLLAGTQTYLSETRAIPLRVIGSA